MGKHERHRLINDSARQSRLDESPPIITPKGRYNPVSDAEVQLAEPLLSSNCRQDLDA